jgi:biopolymer transport protein ExbB
MDRFMASLSTIITAAPMLGILGTVTGIITSFDLLSGGQAMVDPRAVSGGISEALVATASGLVVALISLFPFMGYGAQR